LVKNKLQVGEKQGTRQLAAMVAQRAGIKTSRSESRGGVFENTKLDDILLIAAYKLLYYKFQTM